MNVSHIGRFTDKTGTLLLTHTTSTSPRIRLGSHSGWLLLCDSTSTNGNVSLQFVIYPSADSDSGYFLRDAAGNIVTASVLPTSAVPLPDGLFAAQWVKPITTVNGQTATCSVFMKG
jgi:hypothetical protein